MSVLTGARTAAQRPPEPNSFPVHELQVDMLRTVRRTELVRGPPSLGCTTNWYSSIKSLFRQRQRERHTSHQPVPGPAVASGSSTALLKVVAGYEIHVPIDPRSNVLDTTYFLAPSIVWAKGDHPLGHPLRLDASLRERPPPVLHQLRRSPDRRARHRPARAFRLRDDAFLRPGIITR